MSHISVSDKFQDRHIGTDAAAQATMLAAVGYATVDALVQAISLLSEADVQHEL